MVKYLFDANSFIAPHRLYYSNDIVPSFWVWLESKYSNKIFLIDKVRDELTISRDFVGDWVSDSINNYGNIIYTQSNQEIIANYARVIQHIKNCGYYQPASFNQWSQLDSADPFLIATAMKFNNNDEEAVIVTMEERIRGLHINNPIKKEPRIPNVADEFDIKCIDLFEFMRRTQCNL